MRMHPSFAFTLQESLPKAFLRARSRKVDLRFSEQDRAPNRGRRSAERRIQPCPRHAGGCCHSLALRARRRPDVGGRSPFGAPPRLSPEAQRPTGSAPGHASWDADRAGVTRLHLSQSRDCTSRTGRSTGVNDAQSRPGAGRNTARGNRPRSTFESTLAKGPSVNEMGVM
jgi:hypothetical protein